MGILKLESESYSAKALWKYELYSYLPEDGVNLRNVVCWCNKHIKKSLTVVYTLNTKYIMKVLMLVGLDTPGPCWTKTLKSL
jgi:hypothetical protein